MFFKQVECTPIPLDVDILLVKMNVVEDALAHHVDVVVGTEPYVGHICYDAIFLESNHTWYVTFLWI